MKFVLVDFQHIGSGGFGTLGLVTLVRKLGHEASLIGGEDVIQLLQDERKIRQVLSAEKPDVIGLSVMTPYADYIGPMGDLVRQTLGQVPIIVGGYHSTIFGSQVFQENQCVDYVAVGDAEDSLPALLERLSSGHGGSVEGILAREEAGSVPVKPALAPKSDDTLDHIPFADEEAIHPAYYNPALMRGHGSLPLSSRYVLYSRGCPFRCSFCQIENDGGFRTRYRRYSAELVTAHLEEMIKRYELKGVCFLDDNFTLDKDWAQAVCEGILRKGLKFNWWAQVRGNLADYDLMRLMRRAGCIVAAITIESGNDRIRRQVMCKDITREEIHRAYRMAKRLGMLTQGTLMMGSPTETWEECLDSIDFFRKMDPDWAGVLLTTPLPGTSMHARYADRIRVTCYRDYDIALQESHYGRDDVEMAFHKIDPTALLEALHQIRHEYSYAERAKPSLRNISSRQRLLWMLRHRKQSR